MDARFITATFCLVVAVGTNAQSVAVDRFTMAHGWSDAFLTSMVGGAVGPDDIAYHPATGSLFVSHAIPSLPNEILIEYDFSGNVIEIDLLLPGSGGLCAYAGGSLLVSFANVIVEVDGVGAPVPGGINLNVPGFGDIADLDFDPLGNLWILDGITGRFAIIDLATGIPTTQFIAPFTANGMCFRGDNGHLMVVAASGGPGVAVGQIVEFDTTGTILATGLNSTTSTLIDNRDPCNPNQGSFLSVNGLTWVPGLDMLAVTSFNGVNGNNIATFAPVGTAFIGSFGTNHVRGDGLPFVLEAAGDAVIGSSGFDLTLYNIDPGTTWLLGASFFRDCSSPMLGASAQALIVPTAPFGFVQPFIATQSLTWFPVPLFGAPAVLGGIDVFLQAAGIDLSSSPPNLITSACLRLHLL